MPPTDADDLLPRLEQLNEIGIALSKERDTGHLLERILLAAKQLCGADAGTLYRVAEDRTVHFEMMRTDSLGIALGGPGREPVPFPPIPLVTADGRPNDTLVVAHAVLHDRTVNIADAYDTTTFDFAGTRRFDAGTGYRSKSFLTVPMKDHEGEILGVLQLINAIDRASGEVVPFSARDQRLAESLASQAAIALTNRKLIGQLEDLFEAFIQLLNIAIDEKSPYTGGHCQRVPVLTMMLAEAVSRTQQGALAGFRLDAQGLRELKLAGLLHDCGKVTTPVHVVDKATKLEGIGDRIRIVDLRFDLLLRDVEHAQLRGTIDTATAARQRQQLLQDRDFVRRCNRGSEAMSDADVARIQALAAKSWIDGDGTERPLLDDDEVRNLTVRRGTLTAADRQVIENHAAMTHRMLAALPWPKALRAVPEIAASHHERLDGKGYPRGLGAERLSIQARILAIADVFEALTARDRPYKPGKTVSESLAILGRMAAEGAIDPDVFEVFVREGVWRTYAERHLQPEQLDIHCWDGVPAAAGVSVPRCC
ncbi:MAG: GAF domain-containing protein [Planctomycetes bacterium]|jgi:HD-GYP domain-containing protein (c-di-GMP phosphodiesterase class II)|nr:GAF domain-containing protein [Planctomycetota bacterium]